MEGLFPADPRFHLTRQQRLLMSRWLEAIRLRDGAPVELLLEREPFRALLGGSGDRVQRGERLFAAVRRLRYPRTGGLEERWRARSGGRFSRSQGVRSLDTRRNIVNPYCYGEGIHDLKEHVISLIRSCPLDCAYCFLREVYDDPKFKVAPPLDLLRAELEALRGRVKGTIYLNAGENADSLILDREFGICSSLWELVRPLSEAFLEFRTKTDQIEGLLGVPDHGRRVVAAFSVNAEEDRSLMETRTATIPRRIAAMRRLAERGWTVGLRFEPLIISRDWPEKYGRLLEQVSKAVPAAAVHSIAFGCLRLTKGLHRILNASHPRLTAEEWVLGMDQKFRYARPLRVEIYRFLIERASRHYPVERMVLSTEPPEVWKECGLALKTMPELCAG